VCGTIFIFSIVKVGSEVNFVYCQEWVWELDFSYVSNSLFHPPFFTVIVSSSAALLSFHSFHLLSVFLFWCVFGGGDGRCRVFFTAGPRVVLSVSLVDVFCWIKHFLKGCPSSHVVD
jgi:hypothetical protein